MSRTEKELRSEDVDEVQLSGSPIDLKEESLMILDPNTANPGLTQALPDNPQRVPGCGVCPLAFGRWD